MRAIVVGDGARAQAWATTARKHRGFAPVEISDTTFEAAPTGSLVIVASPRELRAEHAMAALDSGCTVLIEPPFALTEDEVAAVVGTSAGTGNRAMVAQWFRVCEPNRFALAAVADGAIGNVRRVVMTSTTPRSSFPTIDASMWEVGVHHVHLLLDMFGARPATIEVGVDDAESGPAWTIDLRWDSGRAAYRHAVGPEIRYFHALIEGDVGAIELSADAATLLAADARPKQLRSKERRRISPEHYLLDEVLVARTGPSPFSVVEVVPTVATVLNVFRAAALSADDDR